MISENLGIYGVIYKVTNIITGQVYIGQTTKKRGFYGRYYHKGKDAERLYKYHNYYKSKYGNRYNDRLLNSLKKYGWQNFEVSKTFDIAFSKVELNIKEQIWINYYKSNDRKYGFNNELGGNNSPISDDTKIKMRESSLPKNIDYILQIDEFNNILNRFPSYQVAADSTGIGRTQITNNVTGAKKTCHGYVFIRESNFDENFINPLQRHKINIKSDNIKYILQIDKDNNIINRFVSYQEASEITGIEVSQIARNVSGARKSCHGFVFIRESDFDENFINPIKINNFKVGSNGKIDRRKKIVLLNSLEVFETIKDASLKYNLDSSGITKNCKGKYDYYGTLKNKEKAVWVYYDEYKCMSRDDIKRKLIVAKNKKEKTVICTTTNKIFNSIKEAAEYYKCNSSKIVEVCKGRRKTCGKSPDGIPLEWMYYMKYLEDINN
ncbi:hypothetical protein [Romboutsia timonensis]|uniref:hypothetical protein n=1 Tax=Romboutsia timonensis TaxID=1776391 RepID=UPI0023F6C1A3|nr:hypothetical protein [Romboutsia timonensis]